MTQESEILRLVAREACSRSNIAARIFFTGAARVEDLGVPALFSILTGVFMHGAARQFHHSALDQNISVLSGFDTRDVWPAVPVSFLKESQEWFEGTIGREILLDSYDLADCVRRTMPDELLAPTVKMPTEAEQKAYTMFLLGEFGSMDMPTGVFFCLPSVRDAIRGAAWRPLTAIEREHVTYVKSLIPPNKMVDITKFLMRQ